MGDNDRLNFKDTNTAIYGDVSNLNIEAASNRNVSIKVNAAGGTSGDIILKTGSIESLKVNGDGGINVVGHSELDNVNIAGVVTATTFKGAVQATSGTFSSNVNVGTGVTIETNGQATYTGIVTAQKFVGDGSSLTGISGGVTSDAQENTVGGTNAGDSFDGTNALRNTLFGYDAGTSITSADDGTAVGHDALKSMAGGARNTAFGSGAGSNITNSDNNTCICLLYTSPSPRDRG